MSPCIVTFCAAPLFLRLPSLFDWLTPMRSAMSPEEASSTMNHTVRPWLVPWWSGSHTVPSPTSLALETNRRLPRAGCASRDASDAASGASRLAGFLLQPTTAPSRARTPSAMRMAERYCMSGPPGLDRRMPRRADLSLTGCRCAAVGPARGADPTPKLRAAARAVTRQIMRLRGSGGFCDQFTSAKLRDPFRPGRESMLRAGIVGLPNVGKSTLFNAVTRTRNAQAANYPFCTIDPNVGIVEVPDARLAELKRIAKTNVVIPAAIEFVDIAGLVKGASQGEGLGNKFITHIREVDAIVQAVRCFEDADIHHVAGAVDPIRDIETINTELVLCDLEAVKKRLEKVAKDAKRGDKVAVAEEAVLKKFEPHLNAGKPALLVQLTPEEKIISRGFYLLTDKPTIFAANVKESDLANAGTHPH